MLGSSPFIAKFMVNKQFPLKEEKIEGKLQLLAKKEAKVTKVYYQIEELFEQAHNNSTENQKYIIGTKEEDLKIRLKPLEARKVNFELTYDIKKGSYGDKRVYSGDMAIMNKLSDRAKKISSKYKLTADITIEGEEKPVTASTIIRFK